MSTMDLAAGPLPALRSRRMRTIVVMAVVAVVIVVATVLLDASRGADPGATTGGGGDRPVVGQPIPEIAARTADGKAFSLAALKGQPVWLTFGGTWCVDCRTEAPDLEAIASKYRSAGLVTVGVFVFENASVVNDYAKRVGLDYTFVPDPTSTITTRFRTLGYPTHYFIGRDGVIRELRVGGLRIEEMDRLAKSILQ